jgi:asparagine synthase (glutamine-hydrolysing)
MSAIWGAISLEKDSEKRKKRIEELKAVMKQPYEECRIDRFEEKSFDNGFFACGIQYFNKRARNEELPFYDKDNNTVFTADVVLNGREKLIKELKDAGCSLTSPETPDGELAFMAWREWGCDFTKHVIGLFAIAVYEKDKNEFYLFTDHTGCRCADYSICGNELYFSTLSSPIVNAMPKEYKGIDEQFLAGCESSMTAYMYVFPDRTPFKGVFHTVRGNYTRAEAAEDTFSFTSVEYYNPSMARDTTRTWPSDPKDPAYRDAFREVFSECIRDAIDTDGEVAATISSGLDSSSVATVAARLLQNERKKLHGYTSVPLKDFEFNNPGHDLPDESNGVKHIVAGYPNIEQEFCRCEGMSPFTEMDELVHMFEIPGKAFVNQVWIKYIVDSASKKGCKVLLNGQYGNFTISRGEMRKYFFQKLLGGNILEAKNQLVLSVFSGDYD